jgi:hypothetical protein
MDQQLLSQQGCEVSDVVLNEFQGYCQFFRQFFRQAGRRIFGVLIR